MVIKKIGDHLNKMVYIDSRHIMFFIGVVLLFVGLVAFVGYSVTGKVIGVSHTASEVKLDSEEFPDSDTVREALDELKTSGGGYGEDIPQCITYCLTSEGSYVSLDNGANSVTCANLGFVATLAYPGSSFCLSEGVLYTKSYTGKYVSAIDSANTADRALNADHADRADQANTAGLCTVYGYVNGNTWINKRNGGGCPSDTFRKDQGEIYFCCEDGGILGEESVDIPNFESAYLYFSDDYLGLYFSLDNDLMHDNDFGNFSCKIKNENNDMEYEVENSDRAAYLYPENVQELNDDHSYGEQVFYLYLLEESVVMEELEVRGYVSNDDFTLECNHEDIDLEIWEVNSVQNYFCDDDREDPTVFGQYAVYYDTEMGDLCRNIQKVS